MNFQLKAQTLALVASLLLASSANAEQIQTTAGASGRLLAQADMHGTRGPQLSTDQLEKLTTLKDKLAVDTAEDKAKLKVDRHQLFSLLSKSQVDKQEVLSLQSKMKTLKDEISDARINFLLAASGVLTPEQREQRYVRLLSHSLKGQLHHKYGSEGCGKAKANCLGT
jgi:Spy/CpxP family protein refolding chaperone